MTLGVSAQVIGSDIFDAPLVHIARCDMVCRDEVPQPLRCVRFDFVVIGGHGSPARTRSRLRNHSGGTSGSTCVGAIELILLFAHDKTPVIIRITTTKEPITTHAMQVRQVHFMTLFNFVRGAFTARPRN